jgi:Flp pilus assembly protein TadB
MNHRKAEAAGAAIAGLVALHEHDRTLRQERRLAGKPSFGDRVPFGLLALIFAGLIVYSLVLLVVAVWPWLLGIATAFITWRLVRRYRRRHRSA